ncbi:uncharacterized protein [Zea mays]|uniref:uncharacterized protein n=1 Tax=Zea mays TaxID=4577 RepID=UPI0004DEC3CD|nr:uncharacterized protein LOC103626519 [Zea mays]|eukprot:XP_008645160.1 uncharacterized protein LOC103626519 [Zea mays]
MERRKAIVARMRDLLARAASAQAAHCRLRRSTAATTARKWKRAVGRIQKRGACNGEDGHAREEEDHGALLASASSSSISSCNGSGFSCRDATAAADAEACCSSTAVSCPWPATLRLSSCGSGSWSSDENDDDDVRMAHWVTTDSDCKYIQSCSLVTNSKPKFSVVVLEL